MGCGDPSTVNGIVSGNINLGTGIFTKNYSGILRLTGTNNWGELFVNEGTLQIGDGTATGSLPNAPIYIEYTMYGSNYWNGLLAFNSTNNFTIGSSIGAGTGATYSAGVVSNPGGSAIAGGVYLAGTNTGTVTLTGDNSTFPIGICC